MKMEKSHSCSSLDRHSYPRPASKQRFAAEIKTRRGTSNYSESEFLLKSGVERFIRRGLQKTRANLVTPVLPRRAATEWCFAAAAAAENPSEVQSRGEGKLVAEGK